MTKKTHKDRSYQIGYGKPPVSTRFVKGLSGNPLGRPKSPATFDAVIKAELNTEISDKSGDVNKREAIVRRLFTKALDGDTRTLEMFLQHIRKREAAHAPPRYIVKYYKDELEEPPASVDDQSAGESKLAENSPAAGDTSGEGPHIINDGNSETSANPPPDPDGKEPSESNSPATSSCAPVASAAPQSHAASDGTISQPSLSAAADRMRAPKPHQHFYIGGATSNPRWYTADANRILENVHPDHVCALVGHGCVRL